MKPHLLGLAATILLSVPAWTTPGNETAAQMRLEYFPQQDVQLLAGPLKQAQETNLRYLMELDPDRLLHNFRVNAGLPAPGEPYGGWEGPQIEVRGHFTGHYLSALALMYAGAGDARMLDRGTYMVAELAKCQEALGGGYLSAFPESFWDRLENKGAPPWAPYYTIHKIMAGLYDQYTLCGNQQALQVMEGMADYFIRRNAAFTPEQMNEILDRTEEGGTDESLWNLFAATGKPEYRELADKFEKRSFLNPLARGEDNLNHRHGNTHLPLVVGAIRRYEITGEQRYLYLAQYFWNQVVNTRCFASGGTTDAEMWGEPYKLAKTLSRTNHETCKTYNLLRLTRHLLACTGEARYGDYYERAFFNGIRGTQEPNTGMLEYYVPMQAGYQRVYGSHDDAFWCCTGTGVETWSKLTDSIYFHDEHAVYVNLFVASQLQWKEQGVTLEQHTAFPEEPATELVVQASTGTAWTLALRVPNWALPGYAVTVNGETAPVAAAVGEWLRIERTWKAGDTVKISMPMHLHATPMPDDPNLVAIQYGPVVLAAVVDGVVDRTPVIAAEPAGAQPEADAQRRIWYFTADNVENLAWLQPEPGKPLHFQAKDQPFNLAFMPFFQVTGQRYGVYFPLVPKESDRRLLLEKEDRALVFLRNAENPPENADLATMEAAYQEIAGEPGLKPYHDRALIAMARIWRRMGQPDKARAAIAPFTEPLTRQEFESVVREVAGNDPADQQTVMPLVCAADAGDSSFNKTERENRPALATLPTDGKPFVYAVLPADCAWRGVPGDYAMTLQAYGDGQPGHKVMVEYNSVDGPYTLAPVVELPAEKGWHEVTVTCANARFAGRQNLGADFRISGGDSGALVLGGVKIAGDPKLLQRMAAAFNDGKERDIDLFVPGDAESEKAHKLEGGGIAKGRHMGRGWMHAENWMGWTLKVNPDQPVSLACVYWGSDVGRVFDILVEGERIATQELNNPQPGAFFAVEYPIPKEITEGKSAIAVTFKKKSGMVGGIFACATREAMNEAAAEKN